MKKHFKAWRQWPCGVLLPRLKQGGFRRFWVLFLLALSCSFFAATAGAFGPDQEHNQVMGSAAPAPMVRQRAVAGDQMRMAVDAGNQGIAVTWNSRLGTPSVIRGDDLGKRGTYSGGKGLQTQNAGKTGSDALAVLDNLSGIIGIRDAETEFTTKKILGDAMGFQHIRMAQVFQNLKVIGGEMIVHFGSNGQAYEVNGRFVPEIDVETAPEIDGAEAVRLARNHLLAAGNPDGMVIQGPELVIFALNTDPALAYEMTLLCAGAQTWRYWIDAATGDVILGYNDTKTIAAPTSNGMHTNITGSILSGEGGAATNVTGWYENTGYYYLYNTNRHWYVYNIATQGSYTDINTYAFRSTNAWGTTDRTEMSAARNFDLTQNYFSSMFGRNSFDADNAFAVANVHYGNSYVNAFWSYDQEFYFGDGNGSTANSLAVLDVCGHEFTHAVTEYSANLYYYNEFGALNESFSDIFGACVEFAAEPDGRSVYPSKTAGYADWLLGEDCWLASTALRDMRNPGSHTTLESGGQQPSRYHGSHWYYGTYDNGGVHYNGGVQNFLFYLLCEGGSGTNDGISYSISGIGITNSAQIAYRALTAYLTAFSDYVEARSAWISAARDFNPSWATVVEQAWVAVGVGTDSSSAALGAAVDLPSLAWFTGSNSAWFAETSVTHDGIDAAQSGDITDDQQSRIYITVTNCYAISFWWKVSSEANWDYLRFYIDNVEKSSISGTVDWQFKSFTVTNEGILTLKWQYTKDESVSSGQDAGWLDQVQVGLYNTFPQVTASSGTYKDRIVASWLPVYKATAYELWRSDRAIADPINALLQITTAALSYTNMPVTPGMVYYYWLKAITPQGTTDLSAAAGGWASWLPDIPSGVSATSGQTNNVHISWSAALNAVAYTIYRHTANISASASVIAQTSAAQYDDASAVPGVTYYYWVRAQDSFGDNSDYSSPATGSCVATPTPPAPDPVPSAPAWISASDGIYSNKVRLTWAFCAYATRYEVWRRTPAGAESMIDITSSAGLDDTNVVLDATYYYWVIAKNARGSSAASPVDSGYASLTPKVDLEVTDLQWSPAVMLGRSLPDAVSAHLKNLGPAPIPSANAGVRLDFYLSPNDTFNDNDNISMGSLVRYVPLAVGQSTDISLNRAERIQLRLPPVAPGLYYVFLRAAHTSMTDQNYTNNTARATAPIEISALNCTFPPGDYDGDGITDLAIYQEATGYWFILLTGNAWLDVWKFGDAGYTPVSGDFDGDRRTDLALYQESSGYWFMILSSVSELTYQKFGAFGYAQIPADFDGDGKTDVAVYHAESGYWFILKSSNGELAYLKFGEPGYTPVPGDYDGDGKNDVAVYHEASGYWFILKSSDGELAYLKFGEPGYLPVPGDYDGDGKTDIAVYQELSGYWFIRKSETGEVAYQKFGEPGYIPVRGDFDGDGKTDIAVYNEATGYWCVWQSASQTPWYQKFGEPGYLPVE